MPLELIYLNYPPVAAVSCDNRKDMDKENGAKQSLNQTLKSNFKLN